MSNFLPAFAHILLKEGGHVQDRDDPGGQTKYGISHRQYPNIDIHDLTLDEAYNIYYRDFWHPLRCENIGRQEVAEEIFEQAVHMGIAAAVTIAQNALVSLGIDVKIDGIIGPKTLKALNSYRYTDALLKMLNVEQANYYMDLIKRKPKMAKYTRGWLKRVSIP